MNAILDHQRDTRDFLRDLKARQDTVSRRADGDDPLLHSTVNKQGAQRNHG